MSLNNSHFDSLFAMTALLNDTELQALANKCQQLIADRERIKREELRQELMGNLQKAIGDILHNGFDLFIKNTELNPEWHEYTAVYFNPEDIYHIELEQRFAATLILCKLTPTSVLVYAIFTSQTIDKWRDFCYNIITEGKENRLFPISDEPLAIG